MYMLVYEVSDVFRFPSPFLSIPSFSPSPFRHRLPSYLESQRFLLFFHPGPTYVGSMLAVNLMFVDPCIIVQFMKKIQQDATMYQNFIIPHLYEAQHVSGDTPPIIRSLKPHWQPLVFHTWKVAGRVVGGRSQAAPVCVCRPRHAELHINGES